MLKVVYVKQPANAVLELEKVHTVALDLFLDAGNASGAEHFVRQVFYLQAEEAIEVVQNYVRYLRERRAVAHALEARDKVAAKKPAPMKSEMRPHY